MVLCLGCLVRGGTWFHLWGPWFSTESLRPIKSGVQFEEGSPIWGEVLLRGSCGLFFRPLFEGGGGPAYTRLVDVLKKESGLWSRAPL